MELFLKIHSSLRGAIAENISLNDPLASSESIIEAATIACAHDFIMSLGQGYATQLTERGGNLSGGQRQRIAIARTILSNPQLLVMDEATSALDFDTERRLCANLQRWAAARTVFFITHRLSTVKSSDLIVVMHDGRLEEHWQASRLDAEEMEDIRCSIVSRLTANDFGLTPSPRSLNSTQHHISRAIMSCSFTTGDVQALRFIHSSKQISGKGILRLATPLTGMAKAGIIPT